jgi:diguanylate cyclase (GGDEF)-like protein
MIRRACQDEGGCALALFDIADFRSINARYGDMIGDALLVEVGAALERNASHGEFSARLGGDVFGVCFPGVRSRETLTGFVSDYLALFNSPFGTGDRTGEEALSLGVRSGGAVQPQDGTTADELLAHATAALRVGKRASPGSLTFYENAHAPIVARPPLPKDEDERLAVLQSLAILDTTAEPAFERITRLASKLLKAPIALLSLVDVDRQWFKSQVGIEMSQTPRRDAFCAHAIVQDDVFVIPDAQLDPRFSANPLVLGHPNVRFYAGAPLVTASHHTIGTLCVMDDKARPDFSADEEATLRDLAELAMAEIEVRRAAGHDGSHPARGPVAYLTQ